MISSHMKNKEKKGKMRKSLCVKVRNIPVSDTESTTIINSAAFKFIAVSKA